METRRALLGVLAALLLLGLVGPVTASPAPVPGCPPCSSGFLRSASSHGLYTEIQHSEATVHVHTNGSATWTVAVVPTNESALNSLAENETLARTVAADSFGMRYGTGIEHDILEADVNDGAFVVRYRTHGVVEQGPLGTEVLTYFRDSPGSYIYTELGADELTVIPPEGTTVVRGFGTVTDSRMTATELPDVRDGPFVVVAPTDSLAPGLLGLLAIGSALGGVVVRNLVYFVALPGGVLIGGIAGMRRYMDSNTNRDPTVLGSLVAAIGAVLLVGTVLFERGTLPTITGTLLLGGVGGAVVFVLGSSVAISATRRHLTGPRLVGAGIALGLVAMLATANLYGSGGLHRSLSLATAILPTAVGLGWCDAQASNAESTRSDRLFIALAVAIVGVLVASAPLTEFGGALFLLVPILLTVFGVAIVLVTLPLYVLGITAANAT